MVSRWNGWQFWASGVAGLIGCAVSKIWGKRPVYIVSILLVFVGVLWNGFAKNGDSFLGARFVEGLGVGTFEVLVPCSIGDLFFVSANDFLGSTQADKCRCMNAASVLRSTISRCWAALSSCLFWVATSA